MATTKLVSSIFIILMVIDDFKHRYVKTSHLLLLALTITINTLSANTLISTAINVSINLLFLLLLYAFILIVFREKPTKRLIGSGDIIFILIISPLWELIPFVTYLLSCFITALIYCQITNNKTIPLIGIMGIILIIVWTTTNISTLK